MRRSPTATAPGNTCLSAIESSAYGTIENPINNSKGCGGVMRVASIGLYFDGTRHSIEEIDRIGAETAALTHGHPLGYIPAAALVHIIHLLVHKDCTLKNTIQDMLRSIQRQFARTAYLQDFVSLMDRAVSLSQSNISDLEAIRQLGEGWVAEETLAIAIYCALKYENDFDRALIASVNHSGDSDSTGAVTGNILGAYLGLKGIPQKYLEDLELKEVIRASVKKFAQSAFAKGNTVRSDGYRSYIPALEGYTHEHKSYDSNSSLLSLGLAAAV